MYTYKVYMLYNNISMIQVYRSVVIFGFITDKFSILQCAGEPTAQSIVDNTNKCALDHNRIALE